MSKLALAAILLLPLACNKSGDSDSKGSGNTDPPAADPPKADKDNASKGQKAKSAPADEDDELPAPNCGEWLSTELVAEHCGFEPGELEANSVLPDDDRACRRIAKGDSGRVEIVIGKSGTSKLEWKNTIMQFPAEPIWEAERSRRRAKMSKFPYFIGINQRQRKGKELACTEAQALELAAAIAARLPSGKAPEIDGPNTACDELLGASDIEEVCGQAITPKPTAMEDGKQVYCNRSGGGLNGIIFIVSQLRDAATADKAAEVARGQATTAVAVQSTFMVELKSRESMGKPAACTPEQLGKLAARIKERLAER